MSLPGASPHVLVIGAGSWGTALAASAANNAPTLLLARNEAVSSDVNTRHHNTKYLGDLPLPDCLQSTTSPDRAIAHLQGFPPEQRLIILGVPVMAMRSTCETWLPLLQNAKLTDTPIVWTCKGFEQNSGQLPHEIVHSVFGSQIPNTGVLSGPSFAKEVTRNLPVALTIASHNDITVQNTTAALHANNTRIYASNDVIGVEVGGALKNVMAIACGISDGLELGANARAALITRGLAEITRLGIALGGQAATFSGLTGLGDLVLTATGDLSRNRQVGLALGQGQSLDHILASGMTAEGVRCARDALKRATALNIEMPITQAVCDVLFNTMPPLQAVSNLLAREAKAEWPAG